MYMLKKLIIYPLRKIVVVISKVLYLKKFFMYIGSINVNSWIFILKLIIGIYLFIYINIIDGGVILLQSGTVSTNNSPPSSPSSFPFPLPDINNESDIDNESLSNLNNQLVSNSSNQVVVYSSGRQVSVSVSNVGSSVLASSSGNIWDPNNDMINENLRDGYGLFQEPAIDTAHYGTRSSSHAYNTQYHANRVFENVLGIKTLVADTGITIEFSRVSPLSFINVSKDLVSEFNGTTIIIKLASTVRQDIQAEILECVKQVMFHWEHCEINLEEADKDFADGVYGLYGASPDTEKSFTNSMDEKEDPTTDFFDFEDAKAELNDALDMLIHNNWNEE